MTAKGYSTHGVHFPAGARHDRPYSPAVETDGWVFVSGQVPIDPASGKIVSESFDMQVRQTMTNLQNLLAQADLELDHCVKLTVILTDPANYQQFNQIYKEYFQQPFPARTLICGQILPGMLVEIDAIAKRPTSQQGL